MRRNVVYALIILFIAFVILLIIRFTQQALPAAQFDRLALWVAILVGVVSFLGSIPGVQEFFRSLSKGLKKEFELSPAQRRRNREIMLKRVQLDWIEGVLEASLHGAILLQLGFRYIPEMVDHPWDAVLQRPQHPDKKLSKSTSIVNIYQELGGSFLILGDPGSGKTTTLLELTRELIKRAQKEELDGIPVVFNLSTWGINRGSIRDWLVAELHSKYQVPVQVGSEWVDQNELILMLDGLDEVKEGFRNDCVNEINRFKSNHLINIVITSRTIDYQYLANRLVVPGAILQLPLSEKQIDEYLAGLGSKLAQVRKAIKKDEMLLELARSPLVLSIIAMAYQGMAISDFRPGTLEERRSHLFEAYVKRMFEHKKIRGQYTPQELIDGLTWLASQMQKNAQTIFRIEQLQPIALSNEKYRKIFLVSISLFLWLFVSIPFGAACGISVYFLTNSPIDGLVAGVLAGSIGGLAIWMIETGSYDLKSRALLGVLTGMGMGYVIFIFSNNLALSFLAIMIIGSIITFSFRRIGVVARYKSASDALSVIHMVNLDWSLRASIIGFFRRLPIGLFLGLAAGIGTGSFFGWQKGLLVGVGFMLGTAIVGGLAYGNIDQEIGDIYKPNEGTWRLLKNALRLGIVSGLIIGALFGYLIAALTNLTFGVIAGLSFFLATFIIDGIVSGGLQVVQHSILRILLYTDAGVPLNYPLFLDRAVYHIFMLNVGNGYIFFHRLLLDYFASKKVL